MLYEADANAKLAHWTEATWADSDQQILAVAANSIWDCIHEQYLFKVDPSIRSEKLINNLLYLYKC